MAFKPASCDGQCKGCEQNKCGWCVWLDRATPEYASVTYTSEGIITNNGNYGN